MTERTFTLIEVLQLYQAKLIDRDEARQMAGLPPYPKVNPEITWGEVPVDASIS